MPDAMERERKRQRPDVAGSQICLRAPRGSTYRRVIPPAWPITCQYPTFRLRKLRRIQRRPRIGGRAFTLGRRGRDAPNLRSRGASAPSIRLVPARRSGHIGVGSWPPWPQLLESYGRMWTTWCAKSSGGCIHTRIVGAIPAPDGMAWRRSINQTEDQACRRISS